MYRQQSRLNHHVAFGLHDNAVDAGLRGIHVGDRGIHTDTDVSQQERHYDSVSDCIHAHSFELEPGLTRGGLRLPLLTTASQFIVHRHLW